MLPIEINRIMRLISQAYMTSLSSIPVLMEDRIPNIAPDNLPISCMVWNVQGAGNTAFTSALKEVVRMHKPNVLALIETHMGGNQAQKIASIIGYGGHTRVDAMGFSGGIWIYWKPEFVTVEPILKHHQHITMNITRVGAQPWYFTAVYASPDPSKRKELWDELKEFARTHNKPWLLAGDFNDTRFPSERSSSCSETTRRSRLFNDWIDDMQLVEVEFAGAAHTWARGLTPETRHSGRLDRALCNGDWSMRFDKAKVKHLPALQSDHCPILVSPNGFTPLKSLNRPFKFQASWLTHEKFQELIHDKWDKNETLMRALGKLSVELQTWNREVFGNIFRQKRHIMARISGIQAILSTQHDRGLLKLESRLRRELDDILEREELLWYQKARIDWIKNGDRNTSFFQLSTIIRRWKNKVVAVKGDDGLWIHEKDLVKNHFVSYFTKLFTEEGSTYHIDVPHDVFQELPRRDWDTISKPFSTIEIDMVIKQLGALKAPGPDGYQALFYQKNWDLIAPSVHKQVMEVLSGKRMPELMNETFIVLIPKTEHPELASQFRPIGLCNVAYKIITKVIVNRLKPHLPFFISNTQASFVPGRQITDNIVIFQEVLHTMRKKQGATGYMAIKIDFEKAYDRLRWSFIRDTMLQMNLPLLLVNIIMECVTTASLRVLWNGEPTDSFKPTRGVRQGDPLSPYLFVMCMERFYQTIEEAIVENRWKPIRASRNGPLLSNLFFADDVVLFAEAKEDQAMVIRECLERFCGASGQKVSLPKSRVYFSNNTDPLVQQEICNKLGMESTQDLGLYLGMPTLTSRVTKETFSHLCEKIDRRLTGWKAKYLSLAGRITLANSTISTMAMYSMQTAKLPKGTCDGIDKRIKRFIWGGTDERRTTHLISWENLQKPIEKGGIAVKSSRQANAAFLTKLGWRVLTEPTSLWSRVLRYKYCKGRCDVDMFVPKAGSSNVWGGITTNSKVLCEGMRSAVGNGANTLFWDHKWAAAVPLCEVVTQPIPADIAGATVEEMWSHEQGWKWEVFAPYLEQEHLKLIQAHELKNDPNLADLIYWQGNSKGKFSIKSAISIMRNDSDSIDDDCWNMIWSAPVQQRIRAFMWVVCHDRVMGNLNRFKRNMTDNPRCAICDAREDSTLHIIRDCPMAKVIWNRLGGPADHAHFYHSPLKKWVSENLNHKDEEGYPVWATYFGIALWWIWRWRNNAIFGRQDAIPIDQGAFLQVRYDETRRVIDGMYDVTSNGSRPKNETYIRWTPPHDGWYSLNVDGAAKGTPGPAGGGGIIRDHRGVFVSAFAASFGHCSAFMAEVKALSKGLELAKSLHIKKLLVQMDNLACVQALLNRTISRSECTHLLQDCLTRIECPEWTVKLLHVYREGNRAADWLANHGAAHHIETYIFHNAPVELGRIISEDSRGVAIPRLVPL